MTIKVGIVTPPDLSDNLKKYDKDELEKIIKNRLGKDVEIELKVDPIIGSSEDLKRAFSVLVSIKKEAGWDYVFSLSDLPQIDKGKSIIYEYLDKEKIMLIFLPSLGAIGVKKKIAYYFATLLDDDRQKHERLYSRPGMGYVNLLVGMVIQNRPWVGLSNFKTIISVAFATGTYISIFSMPWELSIVYSSTRLSLFSLAAITGMVIWLIYAHNLWEKVSLFSDEKYRMLYNVTTIATVTTLTVMSYIVIMVLITISILLFVPEHLFNYMTEGEHPSEVFNYFNLVWFTSSLALIAGALGSTVQNEEKIKYITYSYRQYYRYKLIKEKEEEDDE